MAQERNAKGEGSFKVNPDGTVTHRKSVGYKANGRRKILTVTEATKTACIREMKKKEAEWEKKKAAFHVYEKNKVSELCYRHLNYQIENEDLKPKSVDRRECTIVNQIERYDIGKMQVHSVTPVDIDNHIQLLIKEGKLAESSITKALDVLNAAYAWAVMQGDLESKPVEPVKAKLMKKLSKMSAKKADEADVSVLSDKEVDIFVEEALKTYSNGKPVYIAGDYMLLLLYSGMRCGEMIALRWKDVDWDHGLLTIERSASMIRNRDKKSENENNYVMHEGSTKNQKARIVELTPEAKHILQRLYQCNRLSGKG